MDQPIKNYADSLYEKALMESVRTVRADVSEYLHQRASRNTGGLPWSGVATQNILQAHVGHVERCMAGRVESYRKAFEEAQKIPTEEDFSAIAQEFKGTQMQQARHSSIALQNLLRAQELRATSI